MSERVPIRVLFVEDSPLDVELEERELRRGGLDVLTHRVETLDELEGALLTWKPDIVLSDFSLPRLQGISVLETVRKRLPEIPFIFVSGTIGEERAIEAMKRGATDYVVKDRLNGLVIRVKRAIEETQERHRRQKLEEALRQSQKMEAIGRLAGGVAHDFNNLLTVINGYSELLLARMMPDHPMKNELQEIHAAGNRAAGLTRQLLAFSRKQLSEPKLVYMNSVVTGVERMLRRLIGDDIELVTILGPDHWYVRVDPGHLEQVIMNLVVNARDAMPHGGRIIIQTSHVLLDEAYVMLHPQARGGPHLLLSVTDTGTGMDQETMSHLFEPFFTTKEPGTGTGLGLSTVHGIVRQANGHVDVESEPGQGSTFKIYLPRVEKTSETDRAARPTRIGTQGTETILLVEDSDTVRKLCEHMLRTAGYQLLVASDGLEALEIAKGYPEVIHLLLTDTVMPGMRGPELALHIRRMRPGIRVLFMSGYTNRDIPDQGVLDAGATFIEKPFTHEGLLGKIRESLQSP